MTDDPQRPPPHRYLPETYQRIRDSLYTAYYLIGETKKANNIRDCGRTYLRYHCADCHAERDLALFCHQRLCPICAYQRRNRILATYHTALSEVQAPKMLTLTYHSQKELTKPLLQQCHRQFAEFRHTRLWKDAVRGGITGFELTYGEAGWHPHSHSLLDADYIPVVELSREWRKHSDGAMVVHIKAVQTQDGVEEVVKYTAKATSFYATPSLVRQYLDATHKTRFLTTYGSFYRASDPLPPKPPSTHPTSIFDPHNPIPPGAPRLTQCPICHSSNIMLTGRLEDELIPDTPAVQIPF